MRVSLVAPPFSHTLFGYLFLKPLRLTWHVSATAEHVYEGQLLGEFFTTWLVEGKVPRQDPDPGTTSGKVDCEWLKDWILKPDGTAYPWEDPLVRGEAVSLAQLLHTELGNIVHKDRLTIMIGRLNNKKQNVSDALQPIYWPKDLTTAALRPDKAVPGQEISENEFG
jgi:chitinase